MAPLRFGGGLEIVRDLDDARDGVARLAEEFQAHGADVLGHAVQHPARGGDQSVAAFLLHARQAAQELVGHVLAESRLAKCGAVDIEPFAAQYLGLIGVVAAVLPDQFEARDRHVVNLAEIVIQPRDFEPVAVGVDHAPPRQIVDRRAPQHGLLAAGVHGDVAAHAGGIRRGGVDGEHEAGPLGRFGDALGDHARRRENAGRAGRDARQAATSRTAPKVSSFSVLMTADHGVSGTAPPV